MDAVSYASSSILGFDDSHPATTRARELFRLMILKFSGITNLKEIQSYWHILALDAACRELQVAFDKKALKRKLSISLDKYMKSLNMVRSVLQLDWNTEVTIESLDSCFGSGGLASRAHALLSEFRSKLDDSPVAAYDFQSHINVYNACAFMEAAKLAKTPLENMKSQILDFCEVAVSLFHQKRFFFVQALNIDTKRPSISLTVPGAIDSLPSATGIASKPSEALTKPAKGKDYNISSHSKSALKTSTPLDSLQNIRYGQSEKPISSMQRENSIDNRNFSNNLKDDASSIPPASESEASAQMLANKFKTYNASTEPLDESSSSYQDSHRFEARNAIPQASSKRAVELVGGAGHLIEVIQAEATTASEAAETRRQQRQEYDRWKEAVISERRRRENEGMLTEEVS